MVAGANGFIEPILSQHLQKCLSVSIAGVGALFFISAGAYTFPTPFIGRFTRWIGPVQCMLLGCIIISSSFLALGPTPFFSVLNDTITMWVLQVAFLVGIGLGSALALLPSMPIMTDHLAGAGPRATDAVTGLWCSLYALGSGIGPLLGGITTHQFGLPWASTSVTCVSALCAAGLFAVAVTETERLEAP